MLLPVCARKTPVHPSLLQVCQSLLSITACCKSHSSFYHAWQALDGHRHTWTFSPFILEQCYIGLCICSTISTGSWVCFSQAHASHFWLNEGWVAYIEQLLQELICTPGHGLSYIVSYKNLVYSLQLLSPFPRYQRLSLSHMMSERILT